VIEVLRANEGSKVRDPDRLGILSEAVAEVVSQQLDAGIDVVNNGEADRISYSTYIRDRLGGFEGEQKLVRMYELRAFRGYANRIDAAYRQALTPSCDRPVTLVDPEAVLRETQTLRGALDGQRYTEAFVSAASPGVIALFFWNGFYGSYEEYLWALGRAMRHDYERIIDAGLVLQLDCPDLLMGRHMGHRELTVEEFRRMAALHIEVMNHAIRGLPTERMRMHTCWGNYDGPHQLDIPLEEVIDIILRAEVQGLSIASCNPRHAHEWQVFEKVRLPDSKVLFPGVIDTTSNYIEHPDLVAERITRYARLVGRENVIAAPDCGFDTFAGLAMVQEEIVWAKLRSLVEGARRASAQLW
jgi:5-methyltetrahydropteroyltriglutamate--homocysteine methyltransferase